MKLLHQKFWNNSVEAWLIAAAIVIAVYVVLRVIVGALSRRNWEALGGPLGRAAWLLKPMFGRVVRPFLLLVGVLIAKETLVLPDVVHAVLSKAAIFAGFVQTVVWANLAISLYTERYVRSKAGSDPSIATAVGIISIVAKGIVFSLLALVALDQVGVNVTALVAGLGVGGIAVALAAQSLLGDLFASLTIIMDKPFVVGDFLIVGDMSGTVEHVGLKTTRLRAVNGEQFICPNSDLLQSRIRNFKKMSARRMEFVFGVLYETPSDKLKRIPEMVKGIVVAAGRTRIDRVNFTKFGDSSLDFTVSYFVDNPEGNLHHEIQEKINYALFDRFSAEGIGFAYPTRTLYVTQAKA